jgi:hypothetical protein
MTELVYTVTVERTDEYELGKLVKQLDVWCMQRWGRPGPDQLWSRNRNRFYTKRGSRREPKRYYTIYSFRDQAAAFEFKLAHI